jgi:hypothetical protein
LDYSGVSDTLILRDYYNREYEWKQKMDALRARWRAEAGISPSQQQMYPPEARERRSKDEEIVEAAPAPINPSDPHFRAWQRGIRYRTVEEATRILDDDSAQDLMDTAGPDRGIVALWPGDRWAFFSHADNGWQAQKGSGEILTDERFEGIEQAMYRDYLDA